MCWVQCTWGQIPAFCINVEEDFPNRIGLFQTSKTSNATWLRIEHSSNHVEMFWFRGSHQQNCNKHCKNTRWRWNGNDGKLSNSLLKSPHGILMEWSSLPRTRNQVIVSWLPLHLSPVGQDVIHVLLTFVVQGLIHHGKNAKTGGKKKLSVYVRFDRLRRRWEVGTYLVMIVGGPVSFVWNQVLPVRAYRKAGDTFRWTHLTFFNWILKNNLGIPTWVSEGV